LLFLWTGDLPRARSLIEQLIAYAGRYSLEPFRAAGLALKGRLAIACDETENGIALLRNVLRTRHEYTIAVTRVVKHYDNFIVTADIDGNFDKRGLPDPLVLAFYFTPHDDLIIQLIILRNRHDI
jgi:hypothetical protein